MDADEGRGRPPLRASDADRDGVLPLLNHALSTGQLTAEEHGERVHAALQAKTVDDLHRITADLVPGAAAPAASQVAPPGWYAAPGQPGLQRYFDGAAWTSHLAPLPAHPYAPVGWGKPPWKGAMLGLPAQGPGALADPGRRLGARLLDGLVLLPVVAALVALAVLLVAPHAGPMFPRTPDGRAPATTPGFVWVELAVLGALLVSGVVMIAYEAVATARYGRTLGKAWLHIRPLRTDGAALGWGRSFGRASLQGVAGIFSWIGLLDPLWCLWDDNRQCLHDKVVGTMVVNDADRVGTEAAPAAASWAPYPPSPPPRSATGAARWWCRAPTGWRWRRSRAR
ncbi:MAG: RDD family protein [Acidobacteriota bacterium]|nr:RDD family protein [Acidobacteriota bacterium]